MYYRAGNKYGARILREKANIDSKFRVGDYLIITIVTGGQWCQNCYIVCHVPSKEFLLIDPGDDADLIIAHILALKGCLKKILLTHAHHDHVGALASLSQLFDVPCHLHKADNRLMRQAKTYALVFDKKEIESFSSACLYDSEKTFLLGGETIGVIQCTGHTPGSVCYLFKGFIFTGDIILRRYIGRTDIPGGDETQLIRTIDRLLPTLSENIVIFPGHGPKWDVLSARKWWQAARQFPPQYRHFGWK